MNTKLLLVVEDAIKNVIESECENGLWDGLIHPSLYKQMAAAAISVFDASMDGQEFKEMSE